MTAAAIGFTPGALTALPRIPPRRRADEMTNDAMHPTQLKRLLLDTAAGDRRAFAELYDATAALVFGIALRVVRDRTLAEDVAQEAYVELWRTAARFDPERGGAKAWIATLAHRRAVDHVRREQSQRDRRERAAALAEPAAADVAAEVEEAMDRSDVAAALAGLTDLQRQAVELAYYGGLTYREVAEHLETPLGTIKTRMRDGLLRLGRALGVPDG